MIRRTAKPTEDPRIARERRTIAAMIAIYCRDHHGSRRQLCRDCTPLLDYANRRLDTCPFQESKPPCNDCRVHCYSSVMRQRIKEVMRYGGPRMVLRHPWLALMHLLDGRRPAPVLGKGSHRGKVARRTSDGGPRRPEQPEP